MQFADRMDVTRRVSLAENDGTTHLRVLVIDDDEEDAALTRHALSEIPWFTCSTDCVHSYATALHAIRIGVYDVILLDHGLGARSGLDLLEEAFGSTLSVAVVLLTGMASHQVDEAASRAGIAHLLEKSELRAGPLERSVRYALERTRIERELRSTRAFFRSAFDALSDHVAILDERGRIIEVNRAWQTFAEDNGYAEALAGRGESYLQVCDTAALGGDESAGGVAKGLRQMLAGERDRFTMMYPCHSPDAERWFTLDATRVRMDGAQRVMVAHQNVTERLRTERELRESAERYRMLFESNPAPLWVAESETTRCISANAAALALYGYALDEFLELSAYDLVVPQERNAIDAAKLTRPTGLTRLGVTKHRRKSGEAIDVDVVLHSIELDGRPCQIVLPTDVTERVRAERAAEAAFAEAQLERRLLEATLEAMPVGVVITNAKGGVTHANAALLQIWGAPLPHADSTKDYGLITAWFADTGRELTPEDWPASVALRTGHAVNGQLIEMRRSDGKWLSILNSAAPIRDADGTITCVVGVNVDVTERQEKERERVRLVESLEFERNRLAAIFTESPAFIAVMRGPAHVFEMANHEFIRLIGRNPMGIAGRDAITEDSGKRLFARADEVLATGRPYVGTHATMTLHGRTGEEHAQVVNFVLQPMEEADGAISGVLLHGVDVSGEVSAANALRESEEQYRTLVELSPDGILIHVDGNIVFANGSAARILGASSAADLIGQSKIALVHPESRIAEKDRLFRIGRGESVPSTNMRWVTLDGVTRHMEVSSVLFEFEGRNAIHTVFRDTTLNRQLEEQLRQAQKMEAVGQLAGGVAHDFNNLLTVIKGSVEFLLEDLPGSHPQRPDVIEIRDAADRAAALTRQLLAFSRKQILESRVLDMNSIVTGMRPMLLRLIREDVIVETRLADALGFIEADPGQLEQVILNLAVNARDAMPEGGRLCIKTSEVELTTSDEMEDQSIVVPGTYVAISVADSGIGISPEVRARIFEPFFTTKAVGEGTGLGLATVYGIVKQSGGYLHVDSDVGKGTTFSIFLPVVARPLSGGQDDAVLRNTRGSETILVVEDMDALRDIARRVLSAKGYTVLEARNGKEALEIAAHHPTPIHLLLTDVVMPEMNGLQLAEALLIQQPQVVVLFMSGYAEDAATRLGVEQTGAGFVPKPFSPAFLLQRIREALDA
ncbi:MAG: PAS domain S-box protein [Gemmatimonadota bacterium]